MGPSEKNVFVSKNDSTCSLKKYFSKIEVWLFTTLCPSLAKYHTFSGFFFRTLPFEVNYYFFFTTFLRILPCSDTLRKNDQNNGIQLFITHLDLFWWRQKVAPLACKSCKYINFPFLLTKSDFHPRHLAGGHWGAGGDSELCHAAQPSPALLCKCTPRAV